MNTSTDTHPQRCPSCQAVLQNGAVVCVQCGLDFRTGRKIGSAGVVPIDQPKASSQSAGRSLLAKLKFAAAISAGVVVLGVILWITPKQIRALKERQAAERIEKTFKTAVAMLSGQGTPQDISQACALLLQVAREGHLEAQCVLGNLLLSGNGVHQDKQAAFGWFNQAASNGYAQAQSNLGLMYLTGDGIGQNVESGFYWLKKAADQNNTNALMNLGIAYRDGVGVTKDSGAANKWFERAALKGCAEGAHALGSYYSDVNHDSDLAVRWYRDAAGRGYAPSQVALGLGYANGLWGTNDYRQSMQWFKLAADKGNPQAQHNVGLLYAKGLGVSRDFNQAAVWFQRAADQGLLESQLSLAGMCERGEGVLRDYEAAARWYEKAALQGDGVAQYQLGIIYFGVEGVPSNFPLALKWMLAASESGHPLAKNALGVIYERGLGTPQDYPRAIELYNQAAQSGDMFAMYNLGNLYWDGKGVAKDVNQAEDWFKKAAALGHRDAQRFLSANSTKHQEEKHPTVTVLATDGGYLYYTNDVVVKPNIRLVLTNDVLVSGSVVKESADAIYVEVANNQQRTIFATMEIRRTAIKKIEEETREEREARIAYQLLSVYQLKPDGIYQSDYYTKVIGAYGEFLSRYGTSMYSPKIRERQREWNYEVAQIRRNLIKVDNRWLTYEQASNMVNYKGHWMTRAKAEEKQQDELRRASEIDAAHNQVLASQNASSGGNSSSIIYGRPPSNFRSRNGTWMYYDPAEVQQTPPYMRTWGAGSYGQMINPNGINY